jgi:hypothetical protein
MQQLNTNNDYDQCVQIPICIRHAINDGAKLLDIIDIYDTDAVREYYCKKTGSPTCFEHMLTSRRQILDYAVDYIDFTIAPHYYTHQLYSLINQHKIDRAILQKIFDSGFAGLDIFRINTEYADMKIDLRESLRKTSYIAAAIYDNRELQNIIYQCRIENIAALSNNENMSDVDMYLLTRRLNLSASECEMIAQRRPLMKYLITIHDIMLSVEQICEILHIAAESHHTLYDTINVRDICRESNKYRRCFISKSEEYYLAEHKITACCLSNFNLMYRDESNGCGLARILTHIFANTVPDDIYALILDHVIEHHPQYYTHVRNLTVYIISAHAVTCKNNELRDNKKIFPKTIEDLLLYYGRTIEVVYDIHYHFLFQTCHNDNNIVLTMYGKSSLDSLYKFAAEFPTFELNICRSIRDSNSIDTILGKIEIDVADNKLFIGEQTYVFIDLDAKISMRDIYHMFEHVILNSPQKLSQIWNLPILGHQFIKWFESRLLRRLRWINYALVPITDVDMRQKIYELVIPRAPHID